MVPGTTSQSGLARRLWEATQTDAALRADLRTAYRGRFDVQDALWWRAHPLTLTPGGRPDPAAALRPLQEAVYSRVGDTAQGAETAAQKAEQLRALNQQLARDGADLDAVLERFGGEGIDRPPPSPDPEPKPPARRAHPLLLVIAGAALGVGATIGAYTALGQPPARNAAAVSSTPDSSADARGGVTKYFDAGTSTGAGQDSGSGSVGDVYEVFYHPAVFPGGVVPQLGRDVEPASIRPIVFNPSDPGYRVYAAYTTAGETCLFLQQDDAETFSTCAPSAQLVQSGLQLDTVLHLAEPGADAPATVDVRVRWEPTGSFSSTASPSPAR